MIRLFFTLSGILFLTGISSGMTYNKFSHLTVEDGLSQSSVYAIFQDAKGFIWFGTSDGLNRYDGYQITRYYHDPFDAYSLTDNGITCLYENPYDSTFWIGTENSGMVSYDRKHDRFNRLPKESGEPNHLISGEVTDMAATSRQILWVSLRGHGMGLFNGKDSTFQIITLSPQDPFREINCLETDARGNLWIGTEKGLYYWKPSTTPPYEAPQHIKLTQAGDSLNITALRFDIKNNLYVGTHQHGLFKYQPESNKKRQLLQPANSSPSPFSDIQDLLITPKGILWVATSKGLVKITDTNGQFVRFVSDPSDRESLNDNSIFSLCEDRSGILWVGTYLGGVNKLDPNTNRFPKYRHFTTSEGQIQPPQNILSITSDNQKRIWVNTSNGFFEIQLAYFTSDQRDPSMVKHFKSPIYGNIMANQAQGLFLSLHNGINQQLSDGSMKLLSPLIYRQTGKRIYAFSTAITDSDGIIWFSTYPGLLRYDPEKEVFKLIEITSETHPLKSTTILKIIESYNGKLILGTNTGTLYRFDRHSEALDVLLSPTESTSSTFSTILTLYESEPGHYWMGTNTGLYRFNEHTGKVQRYIDPEETLNNMVYGILGDPSGNLWCSTNNGILVYTPKAGTFHRYTPLDGLQSHEFSQDAYYGLKDGTFFMGGIDGLNVFRPEDITPNTYAPQVILNEMEILYQPVSPVDQPEILDQQLSETKAIRLNHQQTTFSFEYLALSYSQPLGNKYRYMLQGFDAQWIEAGTRRIANYTNIPPGEYIFKVKGANNDGFWNETPTELKITIVPPFWNTLWFRLILIICLGGTSFIIYRQKKQNLKQQRILLQKTIDEKTKALKEQKAQIEQQNQQLIETNQQVSEKNNKLKIQNQKINEYNEKLLKLSEEVKEETQKRIRLFTTVSHEFRTPISLIISPLKETLKNIETINRKQLEQQLQTVYKNASRLLLLINQLLDFRKLETQQTSLHITKFEVNSFLQQIALLFKELANEKTITIHYTSTHREIDIWADHWKIEKAISNILANALKFTPAGGTITIRTQYQTADRGENLLTIKISDTGKGIEKNLLPSLFNNYYHASNTPYNLYQGSGMGLAIAKKYIELHQGTIEVESQLGQGTHFTISLFPEKHRGYRKPIPPERKMKLYANSHLVVASLRQHQPLNANLPDTTEERAKNELVIVENDSSLSGYLKDALSSTYRVSVASEAEKGFKLALSKQPVLILCDAELPGMNGLEFCKKCKTHPKTQHIPLILLSAQFEKEQQMTGLKQGADDYVVKPFDLEYLTIKIQNLINLRFNLQSRFSREFPSSNGKSSQNDGNLFINKATEYVEKHLSDPSLNVSNLCRHLGVSQPKAYRKINSLTGLSISEFIRNIRLKKAATLLTSGDIRISEIAYQVGFSDPTYFTRCFTKLYQQTPSEFVKNAQI